MKILIIDGHPYSRGLASKLSVVYAKGANKDGHKVRFIRLRDLKFDTILRFGYRKKMILEEDLKQAQADIYWCEHLVIATPIWWMGLPALVKGFVDRTLLPKFAYSYGNRKYIPKGLLKGRSLRVIYTQGSPRWATALVFFDAHWLMMKYGIFKFVGFGPVKRKVVGRADKISKHREKKEIEKVYLLGQKGL